MPEFVDTVDFSNLPSSNFALQQSAPAAPTSGSKYFNPADGHEYVYTGAAWVATGKIVNSGPISVTQNTDGTQTVSVATATTTSAGLLSVPYSNLLASAGGTTSGSLVLYSSNGGITANITGNLSGTATNSTTLNGQPDSYYLNPANLTGGVAPVSAGGTGLSTVPTNGQILVGNGTGWSVTALSAGPGLFTVAGAGTLSIGLSGGVSAPVGAAYVTIGNDATLTNERSLAGAAGQITLTDGGAGGSATIGLSAVVAAGVQQPKVTVDVYGRVLSSTALTSGDIPSLNKSKIADFVESDYVHTTGNETIAGNKTFSNNVVVNGNLSVTGTTTTVSSQQMLVKDNLITVNYGETGAGVTNISAGIEVARGSAANYYFAFFEDTDTFRIGMAGGAYQAVATRVDAPVSGALMAWDATASTLRDVAGLTAATVLTSASSLAGGKLVAGSVPNSALTNSSLTVTAGTGLTGGGSVALGGTTTLSLAATGTAGTYTKVVTDTFGRVISGGTLAAADIPTHNQAWSTITGTPTTLGGYGITDAVSAGAINQTIGGVKNFSLTPTVSGSFTVYHTGNFTPTNGTVTSVAMSVPSFLSVAGSPITGSGTLAVSLSTQTSGAVFAGPATGVAVAPTFRSLVATDIPALDFSKITTGVVPVSQGGTGATTVSGARIALSAAAIATAAINGTGATAYNITNPFGNINVIVQVIRTTGANSGNVVLPTIKITAGTITVTFGAGQAPNGTNYLAIMTGVGA
jgi:hypothetical protein